MKRKVLIILSTLFITSLIISGCQSKTSYKDGSYSGSGKGKNGDLKVEVSVNKGKISDIKIVEHKETPGISDPILKKIPEDIKKAQSTKVDNVSGATITSMAIKDAVDDALKTAK